MKDNIFKTEILDYASKLDAVTNSYGEIVKAASAIVEEHDNSSTVYLVLCQEKVQIKCNQFSLF